jgi:peptidoglycan/LPS O-acetylase OafA/YrhL
MPQLDVLRGIAIALVVLYHGVWWSQPNQPGRLANAITQATLSGWLGVNLFFVLSGFLITGILLDSRDEPNYFSGFYTRRALRIVPAYLLTIAALMILHSVSGGGVLRAVTFSANYELIPAAKVYPPFWSLSVEEQFYLAWPLLVLFCETRTFTWIAGFICIVEPFLRGFAEHLGHHEELVHSASFLIADNLAIGALVAVFARTRYGTRRNAFAASAGLALASAVLLICGVPFGLLHRRTVLGAALQTEPFELLFAALVLGTLGLKGTVFNRPPFRPLIWLGNISYGLYLVHLIVFSQYDNLVGSPKSYAGHFDKLLVRLIVCASLSAGIAWLSRRFYEEPFLRLKKRLASRSDGSHSKSKRASVKC